MAGFFGRMVADRALREARHHLATAAERRESVRLPVTILADDLVTRARVAVRAEHRSVWTWGTQLRRLRRTAGGRGRVAMPGRRPRAWTGVDAALATVGTGTRPGDVRTGLSVQAASRTLDGLRGWASHTRRGTATTERSPGSQAAVLAEQEQAAPDVHVVSRRAASLCGTGATHDAGEEARLSRPNIDGLEIDHNRPVNCPGDTVNRVPAVLAQIDRACFGGSVR